MEEIIGIVYGVRGHTYDQLYDLVFTNHRLVIVCVQSPDKATPDFSLWEFLIGSFVSRGKEQRERHQKLEYCRSQENVTSLNSLIASHPFCSDINYQDILSVKISSRFGQNQFKLQVAGRPSGPITLTFTLSKDQIVNTKELFNKASPANADQIFST
jgi:hypothetical protein